jgi:Putative Actinobacterial Holin-X, holin superfamily III
MPKNIPTLVGEALHESADLAQEEFALFRTEMSDNVRTIAVGLITVIAAAVFAILSLIWLTQALVDWLATKVGAHVLAALIVGGGLAVIAIGLGLYGRSAMAKTSLAPKRTVESLERDAEVLTKGVSK